MADFIPQLLLTLAAIYNMFVMYKLHKDRQCVMVLQVELEQLLKLNKFAYEEAKKKDNSMRSQVNSYISGYRRSDIDDAAALDRRLAEQSLYALRACLFRARSHENT